MASIPGVRMLAKHSVRSVCLLKFRIGQLPHGPTWPRYPFAPPRFSIQLKCKYSNQVPCFSSAARVKAVDVIESTAVSEGARGHLETSIFWSIDREDKQPFRCRMKYDCSRSSNDCTISRRTHGHLNSFSLAIQRSTLLLAWA
ncbi:hypothetical protein RSAG8_08741, partial [Rhizoctonia solani AG-8 WAC10335]